MKMRAVIQIVSLSMSLALMAGCTSTPVMSDTTSTTIFQQPVERVQKAAVDALVVTGFDITKQEPTYVEGFHPRKMGYPLGSGGETVGVWLIAQGPNKTEVKVDTARSAFGYLGQKSWNTEIMGQMIMLLVEH